MRKQLFFSGAAFVLSLLISVFAAEGILRLKNNSMKNYDIEMWRYARELKPLVHGLSWAMTTSRMPPRSCNLSRVRTNIGNCVVGQSYRGSRSSVAYCSWAVPLRLDGECLRAKQSLSRIEFALREKGRSVDVLNGGVGNYNAGGYVQRFFSELQELKPTDIVVHYFLRDAENARPKYRQLATEKQRAWR